MCDSAVYRTPGGELDAVKHREDGAPRARAQGGMDRTLLQTRVFGWNLGGASLENVKPALGDVSRGPLLADDLLLLQETPRRPTGWTTERCEDRLVVHYRDAKAWRGVGISFRDVAWSMQKKRAAGKGCWFRMRSLTTSVELWLGVFYFPPGAPLASFEEDLSCFLGKKPDTTLPIVVQGDLNAELKWAHNAGGDEPVSTDGRSLLFCDRMAAAGMRLEAPVRGHQGVPTSRPRQADRKGHQIDVFAVQRVFASRVEIQIDSCLLINTDHEAMFGTFSFRGTKLRRRHGTGPRVWKGGLDQVDHVDQPTLEKFAKDHTAPKPGRAYRDNDDVKKLFRRARLLQTREAWKAALYGRRQHRKQWERARLEDAAKADWRTYREYKQKGPVGWEVEYAQAQTRDVHDTVHRHLEAVYQGPVVTGFSDVATQVQAFTTEELEAAVAAQKGGKSVGLDLTSKELLQGMISVKGGKIHLLEFFNRVLATREVPEKWNRPLVILLPKVPHPTSATQLRPIALGSSAAKVFSTMLIARVRERLGFRTHSQCAGSGRQTSDLLFSVYRLLEQAREWKLPFAFLKVDVSKAFDSLSRQALLNCLHARLGDSAEFFCFQALLRDVRALVQTPWGATSVEMRSGIKQGASESPLFFALVMELALSEAGKEGHWADLPRVMYDLVYSDLLYMDDGLLWARDCGDLGKKAADFSRVLRRFGLTLNIAKCQLYCTPACPGPHTIQVEDVRLQGQDRLEIMGVCMAQGTSVNALIQPLLTRGQNKFWSLKHLFRCKAPAIARVKLMHRIVTNTVLWCAASFPPDRGSLKAVNTQQTLLVGWLLRLGKRAEETWLEFRQRIVRSARALLHRAGLPRWSTCWLQRWWGYAGHRARAMLRDHPPFSSHLDSVRTLEWWQNSKRAGVSHPGTFFPRLMNLERAMDKACGGNWRVCAQDRRMWAAKRRVWVEQQDLPWASGLQLCLTCD